MALEPECITKLRPLVMSIVHLFNWVTAGLLRSIEYATEEKAIFGAGESRDLPGYLLEVDPVADAAGAVLGVAAASLINMAQRGKA